MSFSSLNDIEAAAFERDGYIVVKNMVPAQRFAELRTIATDHLSQLIAPIEFEVDVGYPGAPVDVSSPGGGHLAAFTAGHLPGMRRSGFGHFDPEVKHTRWSLADRQEACQCPSVTIIA